MNIFVLDANPKIAAQQHTDKHVVKMILESAQMLSTAHRLSGNEQQQNNENIYKKAYQNHPCTIWARQTSENYFWLFELFQALLEEYHYRYHKNHSSIKLVPHLIVKPEQIPDSPLTPFAQAMPDTYKHQNAITAYRQYYFGEKGKLFAWTGRDVPDWISPKSPNFLRDDLQSRVVF